MNTMDMFKGETEAREKKKKWVVSENLYSELGIVINTAELEHELHDPLLREKLDYFYHIKFIGIDRFHYYSLTGCKEIQ